MIRMVPNGSVRSEMSSKLCTRDRHGVGVSSPVMISGGVETKHSLAPVCTSDVELSLAAMACEPLPTMDDD